jgi:hypothetical protein|nr:MAG TPA: hypothetical protein [Caudoviricetes sp.]
MFSHRIFEFCYCPTTLPTIEKEIEIYFRRYIFMKKEFVKGDKPQWRVDMVGRVLGQ